MTDHGLRGQFAFLDQVEVILAEMRGAEFIRWCVEVACEIFYRMDVASDSILRIVAPLEFFQHALS